MEKYRERKIPTHAPSFIAPVPHNLYDVLSRQLMNDRKKATSNRAAVSKQLFVSGVRITVELPKVEGKSAFNFSLKFMNSGWYGIISMTFETKSFVLPPSRKAQFSSGLRTKVAGISFKCRFIAVLMSSWARGLISTKCETD